MHPKKQFQTDVPLNGKHTILGVTKLHSGATTFCHSFSDGFYCHNDPAAAGAESYLVTTEEGATFGAVCHGQSGGCHILARNDLLVFGLPVGRVMDITAKVRLFPDGETSDLCLGYDNLDEPEVGTPVHLNTCDSAPGWVVHAVGNPDSTYSLAYTQIRIPNGELCVDVPSNTHSNGANLWLSACSTEDEANVGQFFSSGFRVEDTFSGKCVSIILEANEELHAGQPVQTWTCLETSDNVYQEWKLDLHGDANLVSV